MQPLKLFYLILFIFPAFINFRLCVNQFSIRCSSMRCFGRVAMLGFYKINNLLIF